MRLLLNLVQCARAPSRGVACCCGLTLALMVSAGGVAQAGQASANFLVRVTVVPASTAPARVFCTSSTGTLGASVTLVCSTGAVVDAAGSQGLLRVQGGVRRGGLQASQSAGTGQALGWLDTQTAPGTVAGWQVLQQAGREYVELTWGW